MDTRKLTIPLIVLSLLILAGLGGWYWYLRIQGSSLTQLSTVRGFASSVPAFIGEKGSTFENIIQGLGFQDDVSLPSANTPPRLWRALATPGAGLGFISSATSTQLRFLERSTGYLFETDAETGKTERLTNTLIPQVYEALFSGDGLPLIKQILDDQPAVASLTFHTSSSTFGSLTKRDLGNLAQVAVHPKSSGVLALVADGSGGALIRSAWDGKSPSLVVKTNLTGWRIHWLSDDNIILAELPASGVPGSAYRVEKSGLTPLVREVPGLTILPRVNSGALLVSADSGLVSIGVRGTAASSTVSIPLRTVAEKCVWAPGERPIAYCAVPESIASSQFLNDWYQGRTHTKDSWWKVDAAAATVTQLFSDPGGEALDVEMPVINDTGEYIAFRNAYDKSIWILRIAE